MTAQEKQIIGAVIDKARCLDLNNIEECRAAFYARDMDFTSEHENYIFQSFVDE